MRIPAELAIHGCRRSERRKALEQQTTNINFEPDRISPIVVTLSSYGRARVRCSESGVRRVGDSEGATEEAGRCTSPGRGGCGGHRDGGGGDDGGGDDGGGDGGGGGVRAEWAGGHRSGEWRLPLYVTAMFIIFVLCWDVLRRAGNEMINM